MNADFIDAHERHMDDAETLHGQSRLANADHLYGLAAECGLKSLMLKFGMPVDAVGTPQQRSDKVHANQVWQRYESYRAGAVGGPSYALLLDDPFSDWDVNQRYAGRHEFDQVRVDKHRSAAAAVRRLVAQARWDGQL